MEIPKDRKMTLIEFAAWMDSDDYEISDSWLAHWKSIIPNLLSEENTKEHFGDCTKHSMSCILCSIEQLLSEYKDYYLNKKELKDF